MRVMLAIHAGHMSGFPSLRVRLLRWSVFLFQIIGQAIERSLPEPAILLYPSRSLSKRSGVESHFVNASMAPAPKQPRLLQHAQVFRDCGERHGVRLCQMRHTFIAARKVSQDTPAGGIGQSGERAIQGSGRILNHLVKY